MTTGTTTNKSPDPDVARSLPDRLRSVNVGIRSDLDVSRHCFRGEPSYVVCDPVTFQSQRLDARDYEILVRINQQCSLGEVFEELVSEGRLIREDEDRFYQFVMDLHRLGFLHLPLSDDKLLYRRHLLKERTRRRERWTNFLFLRVPLWNPDAFLTRTVRYVRPLFRRQTFVLWMMLITTAGFVVLRRWTEFIVPLDHLLAKQNLILMWFTLVGLKVCHEMGHAYACKHFGGPVPEMGAYFILFTPCAYMDATASWAFPRKRDRLVVSLAGMYVESIIAALAVFVWALTGPSTVHDVAYNIVLLAGVVTVVFNVNPLMRYDGYYLLADLVEVPNLRARADRYLTSRVKARLLGIPHVDMPASRRLRILLWSFGVAAKTYRVAMVLGISAVLASKMFMLGVGVAVIYLGSMATQIVRKLAHYLWHAQETAAVRARAVALGILALGVIPAVLTAVPLPARVHAHGITGRSDEVTVRAPDEGLITVVHTENGKFVAAGDTLLELQNDEIDDHLEQAVAQLKAAELRHDAWRAAGEPGKMLEEQDRVVAQRFAVEQWQQRKSRLKVVAPCDGTITVCPRATDTGILVRKGAPLVTIASGSWEVLFTLTEDKLAAARPTRGDAIRFRPAGTSDLTLTGRIRHVGPAGSRTISWTPLTQLGGGDIAVDPSNQQANQPYFEIRADLDHQVSTTMRHGLSGVIQMSAPAKPLALRTFEQVRRFMARLMKES